MTTVTVKEHAHMGQLEVKTRKIVKRAKIQDAVIGALYGAAAVALMLSAPNVVQILKHADPNMARKRHPDRRLSQAVSRLISRGLVERKDNKGLRLTEKGRRYAKLMDETGRLQFAKARKWDGRWRIVIFDIWERRRGARARLRTRLHTIGFVKIQNSVWAYPYECEELIAFAKTELKLGKGLFYLIAEGIEGDRELRERFGLPQP
jgi:hypothetical protein